MTGLHLFKRRLRRRAAEPRSPSPPTRGRWNQPEPLHLRAGLMMLGLGFVLGLGFLAESLYAGRGEAGLLFVLASAFLFLGSLLLLLALGQRVAERRRGMKKRCGCCRFFEVPSGLYVLGRCQADPSRHMVSRADSCPSFFFSERAMVRDHLGQHPRILKQLHLIGADEATNQS
jgi:hypothetical protein